MPAMTRAQQGYVWPAWTWHVLAIVALIDVCWLLASPADLDHASMVSVVALATIAAGIHLTSRHWPVSDRVHVFAVGLGFMLAAWPALRILNYASMSTAMPHADDFLAAWDRALGFDWVSYLRFMDRRPMLLAAIESAYQGLMLYSIAAFVVLLAVHGATRARDFILMFFVGGIATCATGWLLPALGPMTQYGFDPAEFTHIRLEHGSWAVEPLTKVREGTAQALSLNDMPGLTSVPSFHTAMGLICIYCCRGHKLLFIVALAINGLMFAATPIFGAHYIIDLIAGAFLAAFAIGCVTTHTARQSPVPEALPAEL